MSNYRRSKLIGGAFFFTVVTYRRRKILVREESRKILGTVARDVKNRWPFAVDGWVLLPDHLHAIWTLPEGDRDYSKRWGLIKAGFSKKVKPLFYLETWMNDSKRKHRESTIWQRRFWDHQIPSRADWPYSTFDQSVRLGIYPADWGGGAMTAVKEGFGE